MRPTDQIEFHALDDFDWARDQAMFELIRRNAAGAEDGDAITKQYAEALRRLAEPEDLAEAERVPTDYDFPTDASEDSDDDAPGSRLGWH